ncbi:hypothetical protein NKR17_05195 [Priestia flexa]|uniref:hypothetical protein n=1 Tax=Priestia flexa TaxID=86664 RepID=UPI0020A227F7|nr:hypothetical protein [Priestia flexa]MCP1188479.1 hypothetical protein [Priestia flexa]MED3825964.1 hypothetical protein [Priestia flexa]
MNQEQSFSTHEDLINHLREQNQSVVSINTSTDEQFYMVEKCQNSFHMFKSEVEDEFSTYPITSEVQTSHGMGLPLGDELQFELYFLEEESVQPKN